MTKFYPTIKKCFLSFLCAAMVLTTAASAVPTYAASGTKTVQTSDKAATATISAVGSWKIASKCGAKTMPKFARTAFNKGMKGLTGVDYKPVCYLGKQVVAGTNYYYLCKATVVVPGAKPHYCIVSIYKDLKGSYSLNDVKKIKLSSLSKRKNTTAYQDGSVTVYKKTKAAKLPKAVKKAYKRALNGLLGMDYTPIAYLGSQVVAGTNYSILCLGTTVTRTPVTHLYVLTVYDHIGSKKSELTAIHGLY